MAATLQYIFHIMMITVKLTSQCIQTGNGNGLPRFVNSPGMHRIFQHHQAIIYTYKFNCCGVITAWGADVHPGEKAREYTVDFQVWRPSRTVEDSTGTGCYSLVGNNRFTSISLRGGLARATPSSQDYIQFQPGDVLGFYMESDEDDPRPGIVVNSDNVNREVVWYASIDPSEATKGCPYPWPTESDELSITLTHAAPIISISTSIYPCPTTQLSVSTTLLSITATGCPVQSTTTHTSGSNLTPPVYVLLGFIAGIAILVTIVVPATIMSFMKKIQKSRVYTQDEISNQVYGEASGGDNSVYYDCVGAGENHKLESEFFAYETLDAQTCRAVSTSSNICYRKSEDMFDHTGTHVPTVEERERGEYETVDQQEAAAYSQLNFFEKEQIYWVPASTTSDLYSQLATKKYREISREQIQILEEIGAGQFGEVCKAQWAISGATKDIAVKTLRAELPEQEKVRFLQEAAIMGQFSHLNVIKLYGVVTVGDPVMICTELMVNSDLRSYLCSINPVQQTYEELGKKFLHFSRQIASGMDYLSKKSFVHRDLAARNILLDEALHCKIGDFGMARDLMDDSYYTSATKGGKIPVKWTAPEALFYKKYSTDSDVWSYGMLLFEIWSVGKKPFSKLSNNEVVKLLQTGHCQPPPPGCPRAIYKLMVDCWNPEHHQRPSFEEICAYLRQPINKWNQDDDRVSATEDGNVLLGAELEAATHLYLDLQETYTSISPEAGLKNGSGNK